MDGKGREWEWEGKVQSVLMRGDFKELGFGFRWSW